MELLSLRLTISYKDQPPVLDDLRLDLQPGEVLGLVGHSGCGKSSLALAILGLLSLKGGKALGSIRWNDCELLALKEKEWRKLRGKEIAFVPQSPMSSLNPALRLGTQMGEAWKLHGQGGRDHMEEAVFSSFLDVGLPATEEFLRRYPAEISVGQAQRVLIAMAILHRPALLIADEPTSALDAVTQAEILALFGQLNRRFGMSLLFISHDLVSAYGLCHRIGLIHASKLVECDTPQAIFFSPQHPFTRKLIAAIPTVPSGSEIEEALRSNLF
jgi:ABC-type dipeptide/oligopeptide/nickel transport system ATPase component